MLKLLLYVLVIPLVIWAIDSLNINLLFKKNREVQAKVFYIMLVFGLSYLVVNFLNDFSNVLN